jgi:hypothetical protein
MAFTSGMESVNAFSGVGSRTMLATHEKIDSTTLPRGSA